MSILVILFLKRGKIYLEIFLYFRRYLNVFGTNEVEDNLGRDIVLKKVRTCDIFKRDEVRRE